MYLKIQELKKTHFFLDFLSILNSVKNPESRKENDRFPDSPDLKIFRTSGLDMMSGRALNLSLIGFSRYFPDAQSVIDID